MQISLWSNHYMKSKRADVLLPMGAAKSLAPSLLSIIFTVEQKFVDICSVLVSPTTKLMLYTQIYVIYV